MAYFRHFEEILDVAIDDDTANLRPGLVVERGSIPDEDFEDNGFIAVDSNIITEHRAPASRVVSTHSIVIYVYITLYSLGAFLQPQWILNKCMFIYDTSYLSFVLPYIYIYYSLLL